MHCSVRESILKHDGVTMMSLTAYNWFQIFLGFLMFQYIAGDCLLPELKIANGEISFSPTDDNQTFAEELTTAYIMCDDGHRRIGPEYIQCVDGKWNDDIPFCANQSQFGDEEDISTKSETDEEVTELTTVQKEFTEPLPTTTFSSVSSSRYQMQVRKLPERLILYFVFDVSNSIPERDFRKSIIFAKEMVKKVGILKNGTRAGALTFGSEPEIRFMPMDYHTTADVANALHRIDFTGGGSAISATLNLIRTSCIQVVRDALSDTNVKFFVYLFTDGKPNMRGDPIKEADLLKAEGVEIYGIGITDSIGQQFLYDIASVSKHGKGQEERPNVFILDNYKTFDTLVMDITNETTEIFCDPPKPTIHESILELETSNLTIFPHGFEITYACDEGYSIYWGDSQRRCNRGRWSGKRPKCEVIRCPDPGVPENGIKVGNDYSVGSSVRFSCFQGYELLGSFERYCMPNGQWSGEISRCNIASNYCPDPGTPIHGSKNMTEYKIGDKVRFRCQPRYFLVGSEIRKCLLSRTWSGTETKCLSRYDFDDKFEVRDSLKTKMAKLTEAVSFPPSDLERDANFPSRNILMFAIDVSRSVGSKNVQRNLELAKAIVRKIGVSEKRTFVGAITYSSEAEIVLWPTSYNTTKDLEDDLDKVNYTGGGSDVSSVLKLIRKTHIPILTQWSGDERIKYVVFLLTNGNTNVGGDAKKEADFLKVNGIEINCIGIMTDVNQKVLYDIASTSKIGREEKERPNVFILQDYRVLSWLVQEIEKETDYSQCGVDMETISVPRSRTHNGSSRKRVWPWMADLYVAVEGEKTNTSRICEGSIIHQQFILTAAHCLYHTSGHIRNASEITVKLGLSVSHDVKYLQEFQVHKIYGHPSYDGQITYDYDIALLELDGSIEYGDFIRPICLPPKGYVQDGPEHFTANLGEDVILRYAFEFPENKPVPYVIQWQKQGSKIPIYTWYDGYPPHAGDGYEGRVSLADQASLNLTNVHESDQGWYECKVYFLNRPPESSKNGTWVHLAVHDSSKFYQPKAIVSVSDWSHKEVMPENDVVREIHLPIQTRENCRENLEDEKHQFTPRMFCAGGGFAETYTCSYISGGPVWQFSLNTESYPSWTQVGIVSRGRLCGSKTKYGYYTNLHSFMPWVEAVIRNSSIKELD